MKCGHIWKTVFAALLLSAVSFLVAPSSASAAPDCNGKCTVGDPPDYCMYCEFTIFFPGAACSATCQICWEWPCSPWCCTFMIPGKAMESPQGRDLTAASGRGMSLLQLKVIRIEVRPLLPRI